MLWSKKTKKPEIDLILSSSGVRAPCFVGGLEAILERGYDVKRIAGTSGGAIIAAAYALGKPIEEMKEVCARIPYSSFKDFSYRNLLSLTNPSLYTGGGLDNFYQDVFGDAQLKDFQVDCHISVVTIIDKIRISLNRESYPDLLVWKAVRMSSTIPFIFPYHYLDEKAVTDGGLIPRNFDIFKDSERSIIALHPRADHRLRGFLRDTSTLSKTEPQTLFLWHYIKVLAEFFLDAVDNQHIPQDEWENTIIIPTHEIGSFNFDLKFEEIAKLVSYGYDAVMEADILSKIK